MKVQCEKCQSLVEYNRDETRRWFGTGIGSVGGGAGGGILGTHMGIVALGTGVSGLLPVALVGVAVVGTVGYFVGKKLESVKCPNCGEELKID